MIERHQPNGTIEVYCGEEYLGIYTNIWGPKLLKYSESGPDAEGFNLPLMLDFMRTKTALPLEERRGWSTKTQQWLEIRIAKKQEVSV